MNINIIIFLLISLIISIYTSNSTIILNDEDYFINDMSEEEFISENTEQYTNFFNLEEGKNSYCELCKSGSDILLNTRI